MYEDKEGDRLQTFLLEFFGFLALLQWAEPLGDLLHLVNLPCLGDLLHLSISEGID